MKPPDPPPESGGSGAGAIDPVTESLSRIGDLLPESVRPVWQIVEEYQLAGGLFIVVASFLAAWLVRFTLIRALLRISGHTDTALDDAVVDHLRAPIFTTVVFFGLALGTNTAALPFGTDLLVNIFVSVIVGSWMRASFNLSTTVLESLGENHHRFPVVEPRTVPLLNLSLKLLVILVGSYGLLMIWGVNPVGWLASAGIVGIAIGFAAKDTLANLFAGFFILVDAPYKIGDYINLDTGERGRVTNIGLRSTRLMRRDDVEVTLPNSVIANAKIVNESGGPYLNIRIGVMVGVAYGSDVDQVCRILQEIGTEFDEFCASPQPQVRMRGFGASSLDFELLGWINNPEDRGRIRHLLLMAIYKKFALENIEIPFTKADLYIKEFPGAKAVA